MRHSRKPAASSSTATEKAKVDARRRAGQTGMGRFSADQGAKPFDQALQRAHGALHRCSVREPYPVRTSLGEIDARHNGHPALLGQILSELLAIGPAFGL